MNSTTLKSMTPYELAQFIWSKVTYGAKTQEKALTLGYYGKFLILGGFVYMGDIFHDKSIELDQKTIYQENSNLARFINNLFGNKYGRSDMLPFDLNFIRDSWRRELLPAESAFLAQIKLWDELPEEKSLECGLLMLGAISCGRDVWYEKRFNDATNAGLLMQIVKYSNIYLNDLAGIPDFFTAETFYNSLILK